MAANKVADFLPPQQTVVGAVQQLEIPCFTSLPRNDQTPLDFHIDKTELHIDPSEVYLYVRCSVETEGEAPSCCNNLAYSMWQNVEMYINDQKVTQDQSLYPWMSYLICQTRYSKQFRKTALGTGLWYPDLYGTMDTASEDNTGYTDRKEYIAQEFELYSKLMLDFVHFTRLVPTQTEVLYRFIPASPSLFLIGTGTPKLKIHDARLYVTKVKLKSALPRNLPYPASRFSGRVRMVNTGEQNLDWVPFNGKQPRRLYVIQISQQAYNGNIGKNIFNLQTFGLKRIQVYFNDLSLPTNVPSTFASNNMARCYRNTVNAVDSPMAWDIPRIAYDKGYFIYAVDLTNDHSASSEYRSATNVGSIRLQIDYEKPLTTPAAVICFAEFDDILSMDVHGNPKWS